MKEDKFTTFSKKYNSHDKIIIVSTHDYIIDMIHTYVREHTNKQRLRIYKRSLLIKNDQLLSDLVDFICNEYKLSYASTVEDVDGVELDCLSFRIMNKRIKR
jgi:hypothetical protein